MLQINASIASHNDSLWSVFRTQHLFNYDSESYLSQLDPDFEPVSCIKIVAENGNTAFEDVRLLSYQNDLLVFYTYLPKNDDGTWQWRFGVGMGILEVESGIIKNQQSLRGFSIRYHEKNWIPYILNNELYVITDYEPYFRVLRIDSYKPNLRITEEYVSSVKRTDWGLGELRGGTPLVKGNGLDNEWFYGFAHSFVENHNGYSRYYYYTIVRYNHKQKHYETPNRPFINSWDDVDKQHQELWQKSNKSKLKVVFPIGIVSDSEGIWISLGIDDVKTTVQFFTWQDILSYFS